MHPSPQIRLVRNCFHHTANPGKRRHEITPNELGRSLGFPAFRVNFSDVPAEQDWDAFQLVAKYLRLQ